MVDDKIEIPEGSTLNVEDRPNVALCPMCTNPLESAPDNYIYKKTEPDTRWFYCPDCDCHYGYHRMKGKWKVSPHDLNINDTVREHFGLPPIGEE
jgi:uncharacterized protein with PIN domain